jgi:WD domain, G-beta repeat
MCSHNIHQHLVFQAPVATNPAPDVQRDMDEFAGLILEDRVFKLEQSIGTLSYGIKSFENLQDNVTTSNLCQESGQLVDVVETLSVSTASSTSQISMLSSVGARTVIQDKYLGRRSGLAEDRTDYSSSVHPVPISNQTRERIGGWLYAISTNTAATVSEISETISTRFTAPSTVHRSSNLKTELVERRLKKIKELMSEKKFKETIPHLQRAIEHMKSTPEPLSTSFTLQGLQLSLAKALIKTKPSPDEIEPLLRSVLGHQETSTNEKSQAAHYLAYILTGKDGRDPSRLKEAKELCEFAAQTRAEDFGPDDSKTHKSIGLLVEICHQLRDPDEEFWRDMLPESFTIPSLPEPFTIPSLPEPFTLSSFPKPSPVYGQSEQLVSHTEAVCLVAFSQDSKLLVSASKYREVRVWDANSGAMQRAIRNPTGTIVDVGFSSDGNLLTTSQSADGNANTPWVIHLEDGLDKFSSCAPGRTALALSKDGKLLAVSSDQNSVDLRNLSSRELLHTFKGHSTYITSIGFSHDGHQLASGSFDGAVKLWDLHSRRVLHTLMGHSNNIHALIFSPDDKWLASSSADGIVKLWDVHSGAVLHALAIELPSPYHNPIALLAR